MASLHLCLCPSLRFLEERRSALERYLNRLARHPAAAASEVLKVRGLVVWVMLPKEAGPTELS
jgi:hypothetical protein